MDENLRVILEDRRRAAGQNGRPLSYRNWGEMLGVAYSVLFQFAKGHGALGVAALRTLAKQAKDEGDTELLFALAEYAIDTELPWD